MKYLILIILSTYFIGINSQTEIKKMIKTKTKNVKTEKVIDGKLSMVFDIISDHEKLGEWTKEIKKIKLIRVGTINKNGVGAVREIKVKAFFMPIIKEEVLSFTKDSSYTYTITNKVPGVIKHFGSWNLEDLGNNKTKVTWEVDLEYKKGHWFGTVAKSFKKSQEKALKNLQKKVKANIASTQKY